MRIGKPETTSVLKVSGANSLRSNIPLRIANELDLEPKDKLSWETHVENEEIYLIVKKVE